MSSQETVNGWVLLVPVIGETVKGMGENPALGTMPWRRFAESQGEDARGQGEQAEHGQGEGGSPS